MMRSGFYALIIVIILSGCVAVQDFGSSLKYNIQGEFYLQNKNFEQGQNVFKDAVLQDKNNPEAHYYYARFLLSNSNKKKALTHFKEAVRLDPEKSDYNFWLGVTFGELGNSESERKSYKSALEINPENVQALTYMGNNLLRAKKYKRALTYYERTLKLWNSSPQALYNRAVILRKLQRTPEEKLALLDYLYFYPSGSFARRAAERLNRLGDNSYRNYRLGARTLTLTEIYFVPYSKELDSSAFASLDLVAATVANMPAGTLNIIVHQLNNLQLAKQRALSIRQYMYKNFPELKSQNRIRVSWFDVAEKRVVLKKNLRIQQSVQFFLSDANSKKKKSKKM